MQMKPRNYVELAQSMTREEMIVFQLRKQAQEKIDQAYYDAWEKAKAVYVPNSDEGVES